MQVCIKCRNIGLMSLYFKEKLYKNDGATIQ